MPCWLMVTAIRVKCVGHFACCKTVFCIIFSLRLRYRFTCHQTSGCASPNSCYCWCSSSVAGCCPRANCHMTSCHSCCWFTWAQLLTLLSSLRRLRSNRWLAWRRNFRARATVTVDALLTCWLRSDFSTSHIKFVLLRQVMYNWLLCHMILAIWTWSLLQFVIVLTATRSRLDRSTLLPGWVACSCVYFTCVLCYFYQILSLK